MRSLTFAKRNLKEIIREPLNVIFSIMLPLILLILFQQFDIPAEAYIIKNFAPSIIIFGFCFLTMSASVLIAKDRTTSFLSRLFTSPLKSSEFIFGYLISLIPVALIQIILFFTTSVFLGLPLDKNLFITVIALIFIAIIFIALGILLGSLCGDKAVAGVSSVVVQLFAFTSGMYFDIQATGGFIATLSNILPFRYMIDLSRALLDGNYNNLLKPILMITIFGILTIIISIIVFKKRSKSS